MQPTRERVLNLVIEWREARVEDLAAELGITPAAVRRHLDNLRADGFVDVRSVKQATGRPYYAYHPTERAVESEATAELLARMLQTLGERDDVVVAVSAGIAQSLASKHQRDVAGAAPVERIVQVTESLRHEGILETWRESDDGFHLINGSCPYRKAAEISKLPCESDRMAIQLLLGENVEQLNRIVDGSPICEYLVRAERGPQTTVEVS
jgi:predicted ArsR family transcriptional regulator